MIKSSDEAERLSSMTRTSALVLGHGSREDSVRLAPSYRACRVPVERAAAQVEERVAPSVYLLASVKQDFQNRSTPGAAFDRLCSDFLLNK